MHVYLDFMRDKAGDRLIIGATVKSVFYLFIEIKSKRSVQFITFRGACLHCPNILLV